MNSNELRQRVNDQLIAAMTQNILPWRQPWSSAVSGRHQNFVSKRPYSGVNPLLLELHNMRHGLTSNKFATFRQWESVGCCVKKRPADVPPGHWGCLVIFCKPIKKAVVDRNTGEKKEENALILRSFTVFSSDQVTGKAVEKLQEVAKPLPKNGTTYPAVEELIAATQAKIVTGGSAFYRLPMPENSWPNHESGDFITLPERTRFVSPEAFLETALHELAHWAEVRVGWDRRQHGYSMGELVAEISSCYLASELGMPITLEQHAAYLKSWCEGMKDSASFIFKACSMASKTTDYLLSFVRPVDSQTSEEKDEVVLAVSV